VLNTTKKEASYVMLTNKMYFSNEYFKSVLLVFYMFRTSYVHHQEDLVVHAALCGMLILHLGKQSRHLSL